MSQNIGIPTVVIIRNAQSTWNESGLFTGWANPGLTSQGRIDALRAGNLLAERGFQFDSVYSSVLHRATETAEIILNTSHNRGVEIEQDWRLNERHYGALQGRSKFDMAETVGVPQVWRWRRSYLEVPPPMHPVDKYYPASQSKYAHVGASRLPAAESLEQTRKRVAEFWQEQIRPQLKQGKHILITSHGDTLRALLMELDAMTVKEVEHFEIPTVRPIFYAFNKQGAPIAWHYLKNHADIKSTRPTPPGYFRIIPEAI
jgi:2,3-bisphosphoglycerate-dependent phosphoglycerate mutase